MNYQYNDWIFDISHDCYFYTGCKDGELAQISEIAENFYRIVTSAHPTLIMSEDFRGSFDAAAQQAINTLSYL